MMCEAKGSYGGQPVVVGYQDETSEFVTSDDGGIAWGRPVGRYRSACSSCGYKLASVNVDGGTIHCPACYLTADWPPVPPPIEVLTRILKYGCDVVDSKPTSFTVALDGEFFVVTVEKGIPS